MTQQKQNGKLIAIITMIFLFGMISFVTNLAAPMGIVLKNQFSVSNALGMLGNFGNFIAYAVMGIPSGILLQKVGYKKTALIAVAIGFIGVGVQFLSGHSSPEMAFAVYLIGAFIAGFSMCLLNTVVNPMLNKLGGEGNKGNQLTQIGGSFNSVMATITPMFVGILIAGSIEKYHLSDIPCDVHSDGSIRTCIPRTVVRSYTGTQCRYNNGTDRQADVRRFKIPSFHPGSYCNLCIRRY